MGSFMPQETVCMTSFTDCGARNFSLSESLCVSIPWTVFMSLAGHGKSMFSSFVKTFLTKTCLFVHITHSSVNFTWFALHSQQKFDDRPPYNSGGFCLVFSHFEQPQSKVGDRSRRRLESSLFNNYNTEGQGRVLLHSLDCSTLPLILTL